MNANEYKTVVKQKN